MDAGGLVTAIAALIGAALGSAATYALSKRQTKWDLKRQAYRLITSELEAVERVLDDADEYIQEAGVEQYFGSKYADAHNAKIAQHMAAVRARFSADRLILSNAFVSLYEQLDRDLSAGDPYNDLPPELHEAFAEALRKDRPLLLGQARAEIDGRRWWRLLKRSKPLSEP